MNRSISILGTLTVWFTVLVGGLFILVALFWFASCALKAAKAEELLQPSDLEYVGAFQVPPWRADNPETLDRNESHERFGYGMGALAYNPERKSLFASGRYAHLMGEITIPTPSKTKVDGEYQRALLVQPFGDVAGSLRAEIKRKHLDRVGGLEVIGGKLYWSFQRYYSVQPLAQLDHATLGRSSLDLSQPQAEGLWKPGPYGDPIYSQKRTSEYMLEIPSRWSANHSPGRILGVGKGDGAGNASISQGPALFAVRIPETAENGASLDAQVLIHYPPGHGYFQNWTPCDRWTGATWIDDRGKTALLFCGRRGVGEPAYGSPQQVTEEKNRETCGTGKGYHCDPYRVEVLFYDPAEVARSAHGEIEPHEVQPYLAMHPEFEGHSCTRLIGGMAYNEDNGELYIVQRNRENPIVHVWRLKTGGTGPGEEPVITLRDAKLDNLSSQITVLLLEGVSEADITTALELAKMKAEEWKSNEKFESISEEGQ